MHSNASTPHRFVLVGIPPGKTVKVKATSDLTAENITGEAVYYHRWVITGPRKNCGS